MINYIDTKNRQGVFFEPPTERIHLPDSAETYMTRGEPRPEVVSGVGNVESFLVSSRSQRMKEVNSASGELNVHKDKSSCLIVKCMIDNRYTYIHPEACLISARR